MKDIMNNIYNQTREKFARSNALNFLKQTTENMSVEEKKDYFDSIALDAYRKNRIKAIDYILSSYEIDERPLLMIIHLQKMLDEQSFFDQGKDMLLTILPSYSSALCYKTIENYTEQNSKKQEVINRSKELLTIIMEHTINNKNENKTLRNKI